MVLSALRTVFGRGTGGEGYQGMEPQNLTRTEVTHANPDEPLRFSMASLKRQALNEHLLDLCPAMFDLEPTLIKSHPNDQTLLNYGVIAA